MCFFILLLYKNGFTYEIAFQNGIQKKWVLSVKFKLYSKKGKFEEFSKNEKSILGRLLWALSSNDYICFQPLKRLNSLLIYAIYLIYMLKIDINSCRKINFFLPRILCADAISSSNLSSVVPIFLSLYLIYILLSLNLTY